MLELNYVHVYMHSAVILSYKLTLYDLHKLRYRISLGISAWTERWVWPFRGVHRIRKLCIITKAVYQGLLQHIQVRTAVNLEMPTHYST